MANVDEFQSARETIEVIDAFTKWLVRNEAHKSYGSFYNEAVRAAAKSERIHSWRQAGINVAALLYAASEVQAALIDKFRTYESLCHTDRRLSHLMTEFNYSTQALNAYFRDYKNIESLLVLAKRHNLKSLESVITGKDYSP